MGQETCPAFPMIDGCIVYLHTRWRVAAMLVLLELIAWLKVSPDKASLGIGTLSAHVLAAFFQKLGRVLPSCPSGAFPWQYRTWWPARSILDLGHLISCNWFGRGYKCVCGDERQTAAANPGDSHLCRDGAAGAFLF
jgi:hypothetical protein